MCCSFSRLLVLVANKLMSFEPAVRSLLSKRDASYAQSHARMGRGRGHERNYLYISVTQNIHLICQASTLTRGGKGKAVVKEGGFRRGPAVGG